MKKFFISLSWQSIFAAYLAIFFLRNLLTPLAADDYSYAFIWDGAGNGNLLDGIDPNRLHRVESIADIFASQWQHYLTWGGRTVAHIVAQFFVWQGKIFFDVANVFVYAALIVLLFRIGTGLPLSKMNKIFVVFIVAGIHFCAPSLFLTTVWLTGACNYLWMCTLELVFLLPYVETLRGKKLVPSSWFLVPLLSGWSNEAGAAVTIFLTGLIVWHFKRRKKLQRWMTVGLALMVVGFAVMMLAPGNFHRAELIGLANVSAIDALRTNFAEGFLPVFARELPLYLPIIFYFAAEKKSPQVTRLILMFVAASVLVLLVMMCSPLFPERAGFPSTIFLLVASLAALKEILPRVKNFLVAAVAVVLSLSLLGCVYVEYRFHAQMSTRLEIVATHRGDEMISVPPIVLPKRSEKFLGSRTWDSFALREGGDIKTDQLNNRNITFSRYHGLKRITVNNQ